MSGAGADEHSGWRQTLLGNVSRSEGGGLVPVRMLAVPAEQRLGAALEF